MTQEIVDYLRAASAEDYERDDVQHMLPFWLKVRPEDMRALFAELDSLRSQLATARREGLEEAAKECTRLADRIGQHYGGAIASQCATRIRALIGGKGE